MGARGFELLNLVRIGYHAKEEEGISDCGGFAAFVGRRMLLLFL